MRPIGGRWWGWRWWCYGGEDGEVGVARVTESGIPDRIDRVMRIVFELGRKSPPEKFSGGGGVKFLIHTILQCLSAKTTAWNEFSSTMVSALICLATNQKFNFSKYIFERMVKNLDNVNKFLMYPRFVQVFLDQQVGDMSNHKRIFVTPSHTKKNFGNMKKEGKGFSRRFTPLFPTMMVQAQEEIGEGSAAPTDPHHTCHTPPRQKHEA
ncbi:hypothetical protein Tco_1574917 [Tanacetum coccineum]